VLDVCLHGRQAHVGTLGNGARLGDLGGELGDATDLVFGNDRAAGESPHATVNHAHAKAAGAPVGIALGDTSATAVGIALGDTSATAPAETTTTATTAAATTTFAFGGEAGPCARNTGPHGEADVGVRATQQAGLRQRHLGHAAKLGIENIATRRRLRQQVSNEIATREHHRGRGADSLDEIATFHGYFP